jgi:hypothetical protein
MRTNILRAYLVMAMLALAPGTAFSQVRPPAQEAHRIAERLLAMDRLTRAAAIAEAAAIDVRRADPVLQSALVTALERANERRKAATRAGIAHSTVDDPEAHVQLLYLVAELDDPRAVPALARSLGFGPGPVRVLTERGDEAASELIHVILDASTTTGEQQDGLLLLRFMVEARAERPLSESTLEQVAAGADVLLSRPGDVTVLWSAIDLAVATGDVSLRKRVRSLSVDTTLLEALGIRPDLIEQTQRRAAERLAGVPARPIRR